MDTLLDSAKLQIQQHLHRIHVLPIIIVYLNNICDSRCVTCSIWKNNQALKSAAERQMTDALLKELYADLPRWQPRQILLSGGEPAVHPRFAEAVRNFCMIAPQVCVITNGLVLSSIDRSALERVAEFYVSFDAPDPETYERIRGVDGFDRLVASIDILRSLSRRPKIVARCTLQHRNVAILPELVREARQLGFDAISFLGADISSPAFSRDTHGPPVASEIQPTREDVMAMEEGIASLQAVNDGFIEGGRDKLNRILRYFRALTGDGDFPPVRCNAPWISVVIEATGKIRGCFFQPVIGDVRTINGEAAVRFRRNLNVTTDDTCRRCVCSKLFGPFDLMRL